MLECFIAGDSIAVGISKEMKKCKAAVEVGISSKRWVAQKQVMDANTTIISLGANDGPKVDSKKELTALRNSIKSKRVIWILPAAKPVQRDAIFLIAKERGDTVIDVKSVPLAKDKKHPNPAGYKELAKKISK